MSRWDWFRGREQRLATGTLEELLKDLAHCQSREQLATLKLHKKTWRTRRNEVESAISERFGDGALPPGYSLFVGYQMHQQACPAALKRGGVDVFRQPSACIAG